MSRWERALGEIPPPSFVNLDEAERVGSGLQNPEPTEKEEQGQKTPFEGLLST
jgi:hypothetical protein